MKVIFDVNPKDSSKVEICTALLNSMTTEERKEFLNRVYELNDSLKEVKKDIKVNINDIGTITEVVRLMLVAALSNNDVSFKRRILEDAYNKLEDNASLFCFPPFD